MSPGVSLIIRKRSDHQETLAIGGDVIGLSAEHGLDRAGPDDGRLAQKRYLGGRLDGSLARQDVLQIGTQLVEGFAAAHDREIVYRDVSKPPPASRLAAPVELMNISRVAFPGAKVRIRPTASDTASQIHAIDVKSCLRHRARYNRWFPSTI